MCLIRLQWQGGSGSPVTLHFSSKQSDDFEVSFNSQKLCFRRKHAHRGHIMPPLGCVFKHPLLLSWGDYTAFGRAL